MFAFFQYHFKFTGMIRFWAPRFLATAGLFLFHSMTANGQSCVPELSHPGGWYTQGFTLTIACDTPGTRIVYTTNSETPGVSSAVYNAPISIEDISSQPDRFTGIRTTIPDQLSFLDRFFAPAQPVKKGTVIRVRAIYPDETMSEVITATYFVDPAGASRYSFPVFSVVTDSVNFFGNETGIYIPGAGYIPDDFRTANFAQTGDENERPIHLEFFESDGTSAFAMNAGVRIHGDFSRRAARKSLRMYARSEYSQNRFPWPLLPNRPFGEYRRFLLRNSGQDVYATQFLDAYNQHIISGLSLTTTASRPSVVFINGEYWGIHNIREYLDDRFFENTYGVPRDLVDFLETNAAIKEGQNDHYLAMMAYVRERDMAESDAFAHMATLMDMDNYIDYYAYQIYIANVDWPGKNILYWRRRTSEYVPNAAYGHDGRWRWVAHDTDGGISWATEYTYNALEAALMEGVTGWPNPDWSTELFRNLMRNAEFKREFANRSADLLNSVFRTEVLVAALDSFVAVYAAEMPEHIARYSQPASMGDWNAPIDAMREFVDRRPVFLRNQIRANMGISGVFSLQVDVSRREAGTVVVNRLRLDEGAGVGADGEPWVGVYFRGVPVGLRVDTNPGFRVAGWQTSSGYVAGATISVLSDANFTASPVFETFDEVVQDPMIPQAHVLAVSDYVFTEWSAEEPEGRFPLSMVFQQSSKNDPALTDVMTGTYQIPFTSLQENEYSADDLDKIGFPYKLTARTRINGLGQDGISMINTGRGRDLGAVVLAVDTRGVPKAYVSFLAGTVIPNSRAYNLRLRYRIGAEGDWIDVTDMDGAPIEYRRNTVAGHSQRFTDIPLPEDAVGHPYVQLQWKYYFTGQRLSTESGARDMLRLDDIMVTSAPSLSVDPGLANLPNGITLDQNYPNPFNPVTTITFTIGYSTGNTDGVYTSGTTSRTRLEVFDITGRSVAVLANSEMTAGTYSVVFDASAISSGVYIYRLTHATGTITRKMTILK
jgi:hypothetical protein